MTPLFVRIDNGLTLRGPEQHGKPIWVADESTYGRIIIAPSGAGFDGLHIHISPGHIRISIGPHADPIVIYDGPFPIETGRMAAGIAPLVKDALLNDEQ